MVHGRAQRGLRTKVTAHLCKCLLLLLLGATLASAQSGGHAGSAAGPTGPNGDGRQQRTPETPDVDTVKRLNSRLDALLKNPETQARILQQATDSLHASLTASQRGAETDLWPIVETLKKEVDWFSRQFEGHAKRLASLQTEKNELDELKILADPWKALIKKPLRYGLLPFVTLVFGAGVGAAGIYLYLRRRKAHAEADQPDPWQGEDPQLVNLRQNLQIAQENVLSAQAQRDGAIADLERTSRELSGTHVIAATLEAAVKDIQASLAQANEACDLLKLELEETKTTLGQRQRELAQTTEARQQLKEHLTYTVNSAVPRLCDDLRVRTSVAAGIGASSDACGRMANIGALLLRLRRIERCIDYPGLHDKLVRLTDPDARHRLETSLTELSRIASRADELLGSPFSLGPIECPERYPASSSRNFFRWLEESVFSGLEAGVEARTLSTVERLSGGSSQVESAADRLREHLLMNTFSDFFMAVMTLRGPQNRTIPFEEVEVLDREIRTCLELVYNRLPQEIVLGMEYNWAQFDQGSRKQAAECMGIRHGCIAGVQYWGYTTLDGQKIHEKARVDVVE